MKLIIVVDVFFATKLEIFDIIDLLYMRLGYTVLLEWGNSIYTTTGFDKEILRNTLIEEKFFQSYGSNSYITFLDDIEAGSDERHQLIHLNHGFV